jgi:hypothetical protein
MKTKNEFHFFINLFDVIVKLKNIIYRTEQCESQNRSNYLFCDGIKLDN